MNKLYQLYFESEGGLLRHVCICKVDEVKDILEHYGELWEMIVDSKLYLDMSIESLTSDSKYNWYSLFIILLSYLLLYIV